MHVSVEMPSVEVPMADPKLSGTGVKGCCKWPPSPAAPGPSNSSCPHAGAQPHVPRDPGVSITGQWTWLLLFHLQAEPGARLSVYPRDTYTDMAGYVDCHRRGAAFNNTHI